MSHEQGAVEQTGAERYSRRLAGRISDGLAAKFERHGDPAGQPPLGFRRSAQPPHTLEIEAATIGLAIALFERYALGTISSRQLGAETGLAASRIRGILMNPLYNGWVNRGHRRAAIRRPAAWRADPPVSDEAVGDGRGRPARQDPRWRATQPGTCGPVGRAARVRVRPAHPERRGGGRRLSQVACRSVPACRFARRGDATWEPAILAQLAQIRLDDATVAAVVASLGSGRRPVAIERGRVERQLRDLALEHASEAIDDSTYLARAAQLREQRDAYGQGEQSRMAPDRAIAWLRAIGEAIRVGDVPAEKADLVHAVYERIVVAGPEFVSARLTPAAYQHGLALALPDVVRARPTGVGRADDIDIRMPIEGAGDWLRSRDSA